jgi:hypothetical protein
MRKGCDGEAFFPDGWAAVAGLLFLLATSCTPIGSTNAPPGAIQTANLRAPIGSGLPEACTPTGPELCFNAIDDNCNGVIDEGCGEETGLLQFTIAWGDSAADVNLVVVTPALERVPNGSGTAAPGFQFGRDCPGPSGCGGQNVENIYFDGSEPPRGHYSVEVALVDLHGERPPVKVRFGARLLGKTVGFDIDLAPADMAKKTFAFDLL